MLLGVKEQAEMIGIGSVSFSAAVAVTGVAVSFAVIVNVTVENDVAVAATMPERLHVVPLTNVSAAVALPPIAVRSTVVDATLLFTSDTLVHVRIVVVVLSTCILLGENEQPEIVGATSVTTSVAVFVPVPGAVSLAEIVKVFVASIAVLVAAVIPVLLYRFPPALVSAAVELPPMALRFTVIALVLRLLFASVTVHVSVEVVAPLAGTLAGENAHPVTTGFGSVTVTVADVVAEPLYASVTVTTVDVAPMVAVVAAVIPVRTHVVPVELTREDAALPPIGVRLTFTVDMFFDGSSAVQVKVVVAELFASTLVEYEQPVIVGGGSVTVKEAELVPLPPPASDEVIIAEYEPGVV